jgi:ClpP class serine protease
MPNVYERLQREGVQFHAVTAGQFKRTMTPFKKFDQKDYEKTAEYLQQIHDLFKHWVSQYRPKLDIQKVATGEVWCGTDALDMKLCDELATTDDVLIEMRNEGRDLYSVAMKRPGPSPLAKLLGAPQGEAAAWETGAASDGGLASTLRGALAQWVMGGAGGGIGDLQNGGLGPQAKSGQPTAYAKSETDDLRF